MPSWRRHRHMMGRGELQDDTDRTLRISEMDTLSIEGPEEIADELHKYLLSNDLAAYVRINKRSSLEGAGYITLTLQAASVALSVLSIWLAQKPFAKTVLKITKRGKVLKLSSKSKREDIEIELAD